MINGIKSLILLSQAPTAPRTTLHEALHKTQSLPESATHPQPPLPSAKTRGPNAPPQPAVMATNDAAHKISPRPRPQRPQLVFRLPSPSRARRDRNSNPLRATTTQPVRLVRDRPCCDRALTLPLSAPALRTFPPPPRRLPSAPPRATMVAGPR